MSLKKRALEWLGGFVLITLYTVFILYICSLPINAKLQGWVTPSSGVMIKTDQGYVNIGNGQILDFGRNMKVRVTFEQVKGEVAQ